MWRRHCGNNIVIHFDAGSRGYYQQAPFTALGKSYMMVVVTSSRFVLFRPRKHKPLFIEIHRTTKGILVLYLYFRVSGTKIGPGFSGAARFSLSRRAHVKAKGKLDSVEQKNYAVGEQKVGQPRRPTSCVLIR